MQDWQDTLVRRAVAEIAYSRHFKGTLICTGYDATKHAVKGIIVPHEVETGWIPLNGVQTSNQSGTGLMIGPTPGDAKKLDGSRLDVHFDLGDPNSMTASHKQSQPMNPPQVQSGEMLAMHEKGSTTLHKADGSIITTHFAKQGVHMWDASGVFTVDTKGADAHIKTSGGTLNINS